MDLYGWWKVTTEGDCEGRTVKDLGIYQGYVDEIALSLGDKAYYKLMFEVANDPTTTRKAVVSEVNVSFGIDSGTWDMSKHERINYIKEVFRGRPVSIKESPYYAGFVVSSSAYQDAKNKKTDLVEAAIAKLTYDELQALLGD